MTLSKMTEHFFFVGSMNKLDFSIYGEIRQVGMVRMCGLFFALRGFEMFWECLSSRTKRVETRNKVVMRTPHTRLN